MHDTWFDDWKYFTSKDKMTSDEFKGTFEGLQLPKKLSERFMLKTQSDGID